MNIEVKDLDKSWIVTLLSEGYSTYEILTNYTLSEELILECGDLLDKEVIIEGLSLSEDFVNRAIESKFFELSDIKNLSMTTYSNLSDNFISLNGEYINWQRMIIYLSTQSNDFDKYIQIIESQNLWPLISANDLPIDFIRNWKDKLDWSYLSLVKCFTDEEKSEFSEYIITPSQTIPDGDFVDSSQFTFLDKMTSEELENLIEEINKKLYT